MLTRLLVVAHGTASPAGSDTTARLLAAIRLARPSVPVELCFLDVASPSLASSLDERPTVVLPLLLSTGYHVQSDIPAAVAGHDRTVVARHLGPHPLLVDVLHDRLPLGTAPVVLVGAGSSRAEALDELRAVGRMLAERVGAPVDVLTMADDLRPAFEVAAPVRVATYLLAEGQFVDALRAAADGLAEVAEPLGVHPALVELAWLRYDETRARLR